jgi:hypothetical protein
MNQLILGDNLEVLKKPGTHTIALKAVDNDGLHTLEVILLKVNGMVE